MSARRPVPAEAARLQALAADPAASAWVAANAGSGKTHVLVERVVRLLVAGTDPGRILCLTFTRAAAAEMASRVFARLAAFATMTAAELDVALLAIDGGAPDDARRAATRRLFARALETPGGLKIQTIHAFCASLLSRFPLEANVAGRFAVLDDQLAAELQGDAFAAVLAEAAAAPDGRFAGAIAALQPLLGDEGILEQVAAATRHRTAILAWVGEAGGLDAALAALASALGLAPGDTPERLAGEILDGRLLAGAALAGLAEALGHRGGRARCDDR